ncbi:hypothetical protein E308F_28860 [Moorella sp. E308F]|uniref:flagellar export chaperone FlgN n=1 Tax=unclassified Neomoorella TaxID=2676739 RepID=UPI0010FFB83A|nr:MULTISPECIES: flagellar export chaperone FlgN [unclassified Moorella (in: firmicutes)]GEA16640.1 hypothetical protein E308F_28860 [Moorella sp. E308F]GEA17171.1 hypothetical protein E306M_03050 [Moorella sp. E306M]
MSEIEIVARRLLQAYYQEIELMQVWQQNLEQQQQAIQAGVWDELNNLIAEAASWRERLTRARQATRQLEEFLVLVSGCEALEWEKIEFLPEATRQELAGATRQVRSLWEECRHLQEANLKNIQKAMAAIKLELEQVQTARQMARAYRRENKTAVPRCLDRRL